MVLGASEAAFVMTAIGTFNGLDEAFLDRDFGFAGGLVLTGDFFG